MKSALIIFLAALVIILGLSISYLQKELLNVRKNGVFYEKSNDELQRKLMRMNRACNDKERFLDEMEQSITELENKVQLETLERYIPKKTWSDIKPIIDRLKAFQKERENNNLSEEHEKDS